MKTFAGLENLDKIDETPAAAVVVAADMLELAMDDIEVAQALEDYNETVAMYDEIFESFGAVEHLSKTIEKHGISKSLMAHADPDGYLAESLGIPATENLDETPINDANAEAALEAMSETLKKWAETVKKWFKALVDKMKALIGKVVQMFQKYETVLKNLKTKLKGFSMDDKKAGDKKIKCMSASDLSSFLGDISKCAAILDGKAYASIVAAKDADAVKASIESSLKGLPVDALGMKLEKGELKTEKGKYADAMKTESVKTFGYDPGAASSACDTAMGAVAFIRAAGSLVKSMESGNAAIAKAVDSAAKSSGEDATDAKKKVEAIKKATGQITKVVNASISKAKSAVSCTVTAGNAVLACGK